MSQYLFTACACAPAPGLPKFDEQDEVALCMLRSLQRHTTHATVLLYQYNANNLVAAVNKMQLPVGVWDLSPHHPEQIMLYVTYWLLSHDFQEGDEIIVSDTDVIFQADPFQMFEEGDWDAAYTTRGYDYHIPVNGGVWALRWGKKADAFVKFMLSEMLSPSWPPYLESLKFFDKNNPQMNSPTELNERRADDQSFLWAVQREGGIPAECKVADVGPKYNYCPPSDKLGIDGARKKLLEARNKPGKYVVLHYKGPMKGVMLEDWS